MSYRTPRPVSSQPARKKNVLCKYVLVGCPKKYCNAAHSRDELYIASCPLKNKCIDRKCLLVHPNQSINKIYKTLLETTVRPSGVCPYGEDCPQIYCPYDYDKFTLDWNDTSQPDFRQPLIFITKK